MSRIRDAFRNKKLFIPFITCGDPDTDTTLRAVKAACEGGAGIIELGIPFSDPTAEGPVIQAANVRALSKGIRTDDVFALVRDIRQFTDIPLVFMTYANVVFSYGTEKFLSSCEEAGIDGLILPDVPYEEKGDFLDTCSKHGVELISMIAPTSMDRISMIAREAEGFIYIVSSLGVTGTRSEITTDLGSIISAVRSVTDVPCAIGFGISTPEQAKEMARLSDGAIVGSAVIKILEEYGTDAPEHIGEYVRRMREAVEEA